MKYNEWRDELKNNLLSVSESERRRVLDYYAEAYADRRDAGYTEREIIEEFGAPYDAAQRILSENAYGYGEEPYDYAREEREERRERERERREERRREERERREARAREERERREERRREERDRREERAREERERRERSDYYTSGDYGDNGNGNYGSGSYGGYGNNGYGSGGYYDNGRGESYSQHSNGAYGANAQNATNGAAVQSGRGDYTWVFVLLCIVFAIPIFMVVMAMVLITIGFCVAPFALLITGVATVGGGIGALFADAASGAIEIGTGLIIFGASLIVMPLCFKLVKWMWKLFNMFFAWLRRLFSGRGKANA